MMKDKLKSLLRWAVTFIICFVLIYTIMVFGGWKLFESGNPFFIVVGVAFILSIFVFGVDEVLTKLEKRVKILEERLNEIENKQ